MSALELMQTLKAISDSRHSSLSARWQALSDETPDQEQAIDLGFFRLQKAYELAEAWRAEVFDRIRYEGYERISEHSIELYRQAWDELDAAADAVIEYCRAHRLPEG